MKRHITPCSIFVCFVNCVVNHELPGKDRKCQQKWTTIERVGGDVVSRFIDRSLVGPQSIGSRGDIDHLSQKTVPAAGANFGSES